MSDPGGRRGRGARHRARGLAALGLATALVAAACSTDGDDTGGVAVGVDPASRATVADGCEWPMWGRTPARTFAQPCESSLSTETVDRLVEDWRFTTEDVTTASVAVVDGTVYAGDWSGAVYALDDATGEERWRFQTDVHDTVYSGQIVSSPAVADVDGEPSLFVAGGKTMYRLDAGTGEERWRFDAAFFDLSDDLDANDDVPSDRRPTEIQSSPVVVDGMVLFGFDAHDSVGWRAGVVALDAVSGDVVWYYDPDEGADEPTGCAGVWSSPSVDVDAGRVFVGTANCPTSPEGWGPDTEAIVALDLATGERVWAFQPHEPNNDDLDFAGAPNLFEVDGRPVVGLGNKDGTYYVVDRETGEPVWATEAQPSEYEPGSNFSFGGFIGPTAVHDGVVVGGTAGQGADACPCNHGLDAVTGELLWQTREALPVYGGTAMVNDLAFNGGIDFLVRAVDVATGETVWSADVPGVVAGAPVVVGDSVYAVVGLREPGTEVTAEQAGIVKYSLAEGDAAATSTTSTTAPAYDGPVVLAPNDGRCIGAPCDIAFDFPPPPEGLSPTGTLVVTTDPFSFRLEAEGLGDPARWVAPNAPDADEGASVFVAALAVSVEQPFGAIICTFDADGRVRGRHHRPGVRLLRALRRAGPARRRRLPHGGRGGRPPRVHRHVRPAPGGGVARAHGVTMHPTAVAPARLLAVLAALALVVAACAGDDGDGGAAPGTTDAPTATTSPAAAGGGDAAVVLNGQGNHLDAYASQPPFEHQRVISSAAEDPQDGLDINAQLCTYEEDGTRYLIAGEDTDQDGEGVQGWGIFELEGDRIGDLAATEVAKLTPTFQGDNNPENYGCGRLSDGRIVTGDVGNQSGGPATGQLIIWFPPYDSFDDVAYCKLDVEIGTALQIAVDDEDHVYITSSLGRSEERPSGVYRYSPPFPTGPTAEDGCGQTDATGAPLADAVDRELFIATGDGLGFPAGIVQRPDGGFYVSSQASGVINAYDATGAFERAVLAPPEGDELDADGFTWGSPQGLGLGPDGTLYYADIGIVRTGSEEFLDIGPGEGTGSVRRITFAADGEPDEPEVMADGLDFPDGIGVLVP